MWVMEASKNALKATKQKWKFLRSCCSLTEYCSNRRCQCWLLFVLTLCPKGSHSHLCLKRSNSNRALAWWDFQGLGAVNFKTAFLSISQGKQHLRGRQNHHPGCRTRFHKFSSKKHWKCKAFTKISKIEQILEFFTFSDRILQKLIENFQTSGKLNQFRTNLHK